MGIKSNQILEKYKELIKAGIPVIGAGAGTGLSAMGAELGGSDLIIVYNSGRFRTAGLASSCGRMAFSDANGLVLDMANEILLAVKHTPVFAGIFASDPFRDMQDLLDRIQQAGYCGVQNFPTMGINPPKLEAEFSLYGYGYDKEVEMIRMAHKIDLLTAPYCFNSKQAGEMAAVGADMIVAHMNLTTKGMIGAEDSDPLDQCVEKIQTICDTAKAVNPNVIVIAHGGPLAEPEDVQYVLERTRGVAGFFGASSSERIPVEKAVTASIRAFKNLNIRTGE